MMPGLPPPRPDQGYTPGGSPMAPGSAAVVRARTVYVSGVNGGVFVYNPGRGPGSLITSVVGANGTDGVGNATLQGTTSYQTAGSEVFALNLNGFALSWWSAATEAGPYSFIGQLEMELTGDGLIIDFSSISGVINVPQVAVSGFPLPADPNSGTTWVSGERAFMNNDWINPINNLYSALQAAGIIALCESYSSAWCGTARRSRSPSRESGISTSTSGRNRATR
jgi:hypothetical protein